MLSNLGRSINSSANSLGIYIETGSTSSGGAGADISSALSQLDLKIQNVALEVAQLKMADSTLGGKANGLTHDISQIKTKIDFDNTDTIADRASELESKMDSAEGEIDDLEAQLKALSTADASALTGSQALIGGVSLTSTALFSLASAAPVLLSLQNSSATQSSVTALNNEVWGTGVPTTANSRIDTMAATLTDVTTQTTALNNEVWGNGISTSSTSRIDTLISEVWGANPTTGTSRIDEIHSTLTAYIGSVNNEVWGTLTPTPSTSSRIDQLETSVNSLMGGNSTTDLTGITYVPPANVNEPALTILSNDEVVLGGDTYITTQKDLVPHHNHEFFPTFTLPSAWQWYVFYAGGWAVSGGTFFRNNAVSETSSPSGLNGMFLPTTTLPRTNSFYSGGYYGQALREHPAWMSAYNAPNAATVIYDAAEQNISLFDLSFFPPTVSNQTIVARAFQGSPITLSTTVTGNPVVYGNADVRHIKVHTNLAGGRQYIQDFIDSWRYRRYPDLQQICIQLGTVTLEPETSVSFQYETNMGRIYSLINRVMRFVNGKDNSTTVDQYDSQPFTVLHMHRGVRYLLVPTIVDLGSFTTNNKIYDPVTNTFITGVIPIDTLVRGPVAVQTFSNNTWSTAFQGYRPGFTSESVYNDSHNSNGVIRDHITLDHFFNGFNIRGYNTGYQTLAQNRYPGFQYTTNSFSARTNDNATIFNPTFVETTYRICVFFEYDYLVLPTQINYGPRHTSAASSTNIYTAEMGAYGFVPALDKNHVNTFQPYLPTSVPVNQLNTLPSPGYDLLVHANATNNYVRFVAPNERPSPLDPSNVAKSRNLLCITYGNLVNMPGVGSIDPVTATSTLLDYQGYHPSDYDTYKLPFMKTEQSWGNGTITGPRAELIIKTQRTGVQAQLVPTFTTDWITIRGRSVVRIQLKNDEGTYVFRERAGFLNHYTVPPLVINHQLPSPFNNGWRFVDVSTIKDPSTAQDYVPVVRMLFIPYNSSTPASADIPEKAYANNPDNYIPHLIYDVSSVMTTDINTSMRSGFTVDLSEFYLFTQHTETLVGTIVDTGRSNANREFGAIKLYFY